MIRVGRGLLVLACCALAAHVARAGEEGGSPAAGGARRPLLVAYDFHPAFEPELAGRDLASRIADCITGHAGRSGRFQTLAEVTQDEKMEAEPLSPTAATEPAAVAAHAARAFGADVAVWGDVSRSGGGYRLDVVAARASGPGPEEPSVLLRESFTVENVNGIPKASDAILAKLLGVAPAEVRRPAVKSVVAQNLLPDGFEAAEGARPAGWSALDAETCRGCVSRTQAPARPPGGSGKVIAFDLTKDIAETYGVAYYSDFVPVEEGAYYRVAAKVLAEAPQVIIWVKGYGEFAGGERRVIYDHQKRHYPKAAGEWEEYLTEAFRPRHPGAKVRWVRIMLYAYLRPGRVLFDDVRLQRVEVEGADDSEQRMLDAMGEKRGDKPKAPETVEEK